MDTERRIEALERQFKELVPSIVRAMEERFGGQQQRTPEPRRRKEHPATRPVVVAQTPVLPRERYGDEWRVVENKKRRRKRNKRNTVPAEEEARKGVTAAPSARTAGTPKPSVASATTKDARQKAVTLPRAPRTSAVTLTLSEGAKMSYADVVATAREKIALEEIGVGAVGMKKAMTGAVLIRVPGDKDRGKASLLATRLAEVLDPTAVKITAPTRTTELRVVGIDISVKKEELRQALASAVECSSAEVQVGEIGVSRGGMGPAWIKCPVAGTRKLAQEGKVKLGWSIANVIAIPKRPLQCYRCLELGHVQATCVSSVDRRHLCYRCGGCGHRAC
jgi:hypothetical protein